LDQQDKSLLALQIANDAIATALASREKLSLDTRPRSADIEDKKLNHIEADLSKAQHNTDQHTLSSKCTLFL